MGTSSDHLTEFLQNPDLLRETVHAIRAHCNEIGNATSEDELKAIQELVKAEATNKLPKELQQKGEALLAAVASGEVSLDEVLEKGAGLTKAVAKEVGACATR